MSMDAVKNQVAEVARKMAELDLVSGTSGNVSVTVAGRSHGDHSDGQELRVECQR